jgi:pyruvate dehydrogenase E2 component (dihydrolipoamide acetyltransferase)
MIEFRMPSLGSDMEFGTVLEWRVAPGDEVKRGDIVALVDTEKAEIEVEIWQEGVISRLVVPEGEQVPVGTLLAYLEGDDQAAEESVAVPVPPASPPTPPPAPMRAGEGAASTGRVPSSPRARRTAEQLGIDLSLLTGTGPGGAVTHTDVEQAGRAQARSAPEVCAVDVVEEGEARDHVASMRNAIANAMTRSKREIPHYYLETTIDFQKAQLWLSEANRQRDISGRLLPSVLLLKAVALALGKVPALNGHWIDGAFHPSEARHMGVAISLRGGGLLAPAIRDVDHKDLDSLMESLRDLVERTRRGKLRSSEVSDATLTVTSLGDMGVEKVYGVIYPPQVALVGFGRIVERPWAEAGMLGVRPVVTATLAADHRVTDGIQGAKFLVELSRLLASPEEL